MLSQYKRCKIFRVSGHVSSLTQPEVTGSISNVEAQECAAVNVIMGMTSLIASSDMRHLYWRPCDETFA